MRFRRYKRERVIVLYPVGSIQYKIQQLLPLIRVVGIVAVLGVALLALVIYGKDSVIPRTDHGIFSVMVRTEKIKDLVSYNDSLWEYMHETWPDGADSEFVYGHHSNPYVVFETDLSNAMRLGEYNPTYIARHRGRMFVSVRYNDKRKPISQNVNLRFCCIYRFGTAELIVSVIDEYLGIKLNVADVKEQLTRLTLGETEMEFKGVKIEFSPGSYVDLEQHIEVNASFTHAVS